MGIAGNEKGLWFVAGFKELLPERQPKKVQMFNKFLMSKTLPSDGNNAK
jgi:hypothetical protein